MYGILESKADLYHLQCQLLRKWPTVIQISLCLPGGYSIYPYKALFSSAVEVAKVDLMEFGVRIEQETCVETAIGPVCLLATRTNGRAIKMRMVSVEENAHWGRLWDIDVITTEGPIDRTTLGLSPRKCLVCNESAHICRKLGAHTLDKAVLGARRILDRWQP